MAVQPRRLDEVRSLVGDAVSPSSAVAAAGAPSLFAALIAEECDFLARQGDVEHAPAARLLDDEGAEKPAPLVTMKR